MKRYRAFDPPEYVSWSPDPAVLEAFREGVEVHPERRERIRGLRPEDLLALYRGLIKNRLFDIMLKRWVRRGVLSKAWLGTGEEAVTVGAVHALRPGDVVGPMIRNAGAYHEMGMSLTDMFRTYLGTADSPTAGRDLHLGNLQKGVVAPISMMGALVPVCAGVALSFKLKGQDHVALTWAGDGSTRTTGFHEGLSCARALKVPLIVVIQDNQIALGTRRDRHSKAPLEEVANIYGVEAATCDGNHVLDVYAAVSIAAERCRAGHGPVLLTASTFRMGGHATHDEGESREILAGELFEHWGKRDPVGMYEAFLLESDLALSEPESNHEVLRRVEAEVVNEVDRAAEEALTGERPRPETQPLGVYAPARHETGG